MIISFFTGLLASFTPCVVVIIPMMFYRFKDDWKAIPMFIAGFLSTFLIFGLAISSLLGSGVQNGFRIGIGMLMIALASLALLGKLRPLDLRAVKSSFLMGMVFSLVVTTSPCTLPYLGLIVAGMSSIPSYLLFGLGMISPAILFTIVGRSFKGLKIGKLMEVLLLLSGLYLMLTVNSLGRWDVWIAGAMMALTFFVIIWSLRLKDINLKNSLLALSLLAIVAASVWHCSSYVTGSAVCTIGSCVVCQRCITLFIVGLLLGSLGIFLLRKQ